MRLSRVKLLAERDFQVQVRELAELCGWKQHVVWSSKHSPQGWPDLFLVYGQRIVAAELKREDGQLTPAQRDWLRVLASTGKVDVYVWRPSYWDQVVEVLNGPQQERFAATVGRSR